MGRKGLVLRVDGEVVSKFEERVESVQIMGKRGEIARVGIAEADEVIDVIINRAGNRNKHLLDVEAEQRDLARESAVEREEEEGPEGGGQLRGIGSSPDEDVDVRAPNPLEAKADVRAERAEEEDEDEEGPEDSSNDYGDNGDEGFPRQ